MSDTPRTDAECGWYDPNGVRYPDPTGDHVDPDFARDLERELNAAKARIARMEEAGDAMCEDYEMVAMDRIDLKRIVDRIDLKRIADWRAAKESKP